MDVEQIALAVRVTSLKKTVMKDHYDRDLSI